MRHDDIDQSFVGAAMKNLVKCTPNGEDRKQLRPGNLAVWSHIRMRSCMLVGVILGETYPRFEVGKNPGKRKDALRNDCAMAER